MCTSSSIGQRPLLVTQVIGRINLLVASLGLLQLAINVIGYSFLGQAFVEQYGPFMTDRHRFARMSVVTVILLLPLGLLGVQLVRRKAHAAALTKGFFMFDIVALIWIVCTWSMPFLPISPVVIATGLMNGGIALQIVTAYPLIGLILLMRMPEQAGGPPLAR
jgi:hypothetical protein